MPQASAGCLSVHKPRDRSAVDHVLLLAAGVTAHQHLFHLRLADRKARRTVVVRWAACHPALPALRPPSALAMVSALMFPPPTISLGGGRE